MRVGGAFTLSVVDVVVTFVGGMVSVGLHVLLWVQLAGPSGVDVTNMLIEAVVVPGVSLISTNHERQSAALLSAPDIHSNVMLQVASSRDYLFILLMAFLSFRNFCKGWGHCGQQCQIPVDHSSTLLPHSKHHRLHVP